MHGALPLAWMLYSIHVAVQGALADHEGSTRIDSKRSKGGRGQRAGGRTGAGERRGDKGRAQTFSRGLCAEVVWV